MAMRRRQTVPHQWLIIRDAEDRVGLATARRLPRGSGVLLLEPLPAREMRRLRLRGLTFVEEQRGSAARVHNLRELRRALTDHTPLILVSPVYATGSHPEWKPISRMRAAALARLGRRKLFALGGMDARKFARIRPLGFQGWAGISAFRT
jgi:thiamine-phosphate pyrophosphorylase